MTPDELRELFEERAAIMQYCGGLPRIDAESCARGIVYLRAERRGTSIHYTMVAGTAPKTVRPTEPEQPGLPMSPEERQAVYKRLWKDY